jgi:lipoprotein-anchoring transpeptidase ErfK/SrfK
MLVAANVRRPSTTRILPFPTALAAAAAIGGCGDAAKPGATPAAAAAPTAPAPAPTPMPAARRRTRAQLTVHVTRATPLRARPGGPPLARLATTTRFGSPTVVPVVRRSGRWLGILTSELSNGRVGWIPAGAGLRAHSTDYRIDASLRRREVLVRRGGRIVTHFLVAVGGASTPTPTGTFAVTDKLLTGDAASPYGCCILALSGHQTNTPQGWGGGDRVAIHATNLPGSIGTAVSLGCLRAPTAAVRRLVSTVPLGTIVRIRA